jgi:hypothetical protein
MLIRQIAYRCHVRSAAGENDTFEATAEVTGDDTPETAMLALVEWVRGMATTLRRGYMGTERRAMVWRDHEREHVEG